MRVIRAVILLFILCGIAIAIAIAYVTYMHRYTNNSLNQEYVVDNIRELATTPQGMYLSLLYGSESFRPEDFPIRLNDFLILKTDLLERVGISIPYSRYCPGKFEKDGLLYNMSGSHDPPYTVWITNPDVFLLKNNPIPDHAMVEVTHCSDDQEVQENEKVGSWMYYAKGSGVYFNVGKSIAFDSHLDASKFFLGKNACHDYEGLACFPAIFTKAKEMGYDSIQFLHHYDMRCGYIALEIVDVKGIGVYACPSGYSRHRYFYGYKGRLGILECDPARPCLNQARELS